MCLFSTLLADPPGSQGDLVPTPQKMLKSEFRRKRTDGSDFTNLTRAVQLISTFCQTTKFPKQLQLIVEDKRKQQQDQEHA